MRARWSRLFGMALAACLAHAGEADRDVIYQVAPIDALMAGVYEGAARIGDLRRYGDLGLGTLEGLDGELVFLDGAFFQVRSDGRVAPVPDDARTPLVVLTWLDRDITAERVVAADLASFTRRLDGLLPSSNLFYAVRADGVFAHVKTRSVPRQAPPYRPLEAVAREQTVFEFRDVPGTVVGFYSPPFARGVSVPGYHLHFLAEDRSGGGHVLDLSATNLTVALDPSDALHLALPAQGSFLGADLSPDRGAALHRVESNPR